MRCPLILFLLRFLLICLAKKSHPKAYILHGMGFKSLHHMCHLSVLRYKSSFISAVTHYLSNSTISSLNSPIILATRNSPCPAVCHGTTNSSDVFCKLNQTTKRHQSRHRKEEKKKEHGHQKNSFNEVKVLVILKDLFTHRRQYKHQLVSLGNKLY